MTTGLVNGMSMEQAGQAVMRKAEEVLRRRPTNELGIWTETGRRSVLVGVARRGRASTTLLIPKDEYDGMKLLDLLEKNLG